MKNKFCPLPVDCLIMVRVCAASGSARARPCTLNLVYMLCVRILSHRISRHGHQGMVNGERRTRWAARASIPHRIWKTNIYIDDGRTDVAKEWKRRVTGSPSYIFIMNYKESCRFSLNRTLLHHTQVRVSGIQRFATPFTPGPVCSRSSIPNIPVLEGFCKRSARLKWWDGMANEIVFYIFTQGRPFVSAADLYGEKNLFKHAWPKANETCHIIQTCRVHHSLAHSPFTRHTRRHHRTLANAWNPSKRDSGITKIDSSWKQDRVSFELARPGPVRRWLPFVTPCGAEFVRWLRFDTGEF